MATVHWKMPEELLEIAQDGGSEMIAELVTIFREDGGARLEELRDAVRTGDRNIIRRQAHSLKGSALQIGAQEFGGLCRELEALADHGAESELLALMEKMEGEWIELEKVLAGVNLQEVLCRR